ncbi:MAG: arylamine N-acetyltransferase [Cyanobacteria bacterium J06638_22]
MDVAAYRQRIGDRSLCAPTVETLVRLHRNHLYSVPFENLDVHLGRSIVLSLPALFDKVVRQRRGGFCYELNSLFGWLLQELGFTVDFLSGRVFSKGEFGPPFDHLLLRVEMGEPWIADVGFGDLFLEPLPLVAGEHTQNGDPYCLELDGDEAVLYRRRSPSQSWEPQYAFSLKPHPLEDFQDMCGYHQSSPASPFTQKSLCSIATPEGRITLSNNRLIQTISGQRQQRKITTPEEYKTLLYRHFGLDLGSNVEVNRLLHPRNIKSG